MPTVKTLHLFSLHTLRLGTVRGAAALAALLAVAPAQPARADQVTPPPVPANIEVPKGNRAFLKGSAIGTQNYVCLPSSSSFAWTLFTPQATLFETPQAILQSEGGADPFVSSD